MRNSVLIGIGRVTTVGTGIFLLALSANASSPADSFRQALEAVRANQPDALFRLLPSSYQQDVDAVVALFADRMDAEIWDRGRALVAQVAKLTSEKRNLLVELAMTDRAEDVDPAQLGESIGRLSELLSHIASGPITDLQRLRQGRVGELLKDEGRKIMEIAEQAAQAVPAAAGAGDAIWDMARKADVVVEALEDDAATIRMLVGADATDLAVRRVEGCWIPADMAMHWEPRMAAAKARLDALDFTTAEGRQSKTQVLMAMGMVEVFIGQLDRVTSAEELQQSLMGMLMMGGGMGGLGGRRADAPERPLSTPLE